MAAPNLEIYVEKEGAVTVVTLDGPVDSATFDQFKETLDPICKAPGSRVVLDCHKLTYINSKGIGLLASHHRNSLMHLGSMHLCGLNTKIVKTMDLLGLGKRLKLFDTREEALAAMPK